MRLKADQKHNKRLCTDISGRTERLPGQNENQPAGAPGRVRASLRWGPQGQRWGGDTAIYSPGRAPRASARVPPRPPQPAPRARAVSARRDRPRRAPAPRTPPGPPPPACLQLGLGDLPAAVEVEGGEGVPDGLEQLLLEPHHGRPFAARAPPLWPGLRGPGGAARPSPAPLAPPRRRRSPLSASAAAAAAC